MRAGVALETASRYCAAFSTAWSGAEVSNQMARQARAASSPARLFQQCSSSLEDSGALAPRSPWQRSRRSHSATEEGHCSLIVQGVPPEVSILPSGEKASGKEQGV